MKSELRKKALFARRNIADRDEKQKKLEQCFLKNFSQYESYFIYYSFASEAGTREIVDELLNRGKRVFLPKTDDDKMFAVEIFDVKTLKQKDGTKFLQPEGENYGGKIDVAIVPLLAVDNFGNRLGYGKGYYDRFLRDKEILKVGLCFDCQILPYVEHDEFDVRLDFILTENGLYEVPSR